MKYKLIKPINKEYSALGQVLTNRGIDKDLINSYLMTTDNDINSYESLGLNALHEAITKIAKCVKADANALVIVDSDCDGFTSSALLINYLHDLFPAWVENHVSWFMHEGKQHGLSDLSFEPESIGNYKLILIPDASSNDYTYHEALHRIGIDVVVLDHHEASYVSDYATVINNQLSLYPNKEMSGVGIVWQFCRFVDSLMKTNYANNYLDLVGLGMDADMMSLKSFETKHLINKGFEEQNIKNPFFSAICDKHSFSMKNMVTPMSVAFYVAPYVNAIVRSGTMAEKEVVFLSMLNHRAFEKVPSTKRGHKLGEMEQIYVQAMRVVTNVKNRQTRAQDAGMAHLEQMIEEQDLLKDKVLLFLLMPGDIDKNIAGLVANKMMARYQRPCCILTRVEEEDGRVSYQGSARGCDKTGVSEFKSICEETECILFAEGHQGAFGLGIELGNISEFLEKTNEVLKDISDEAVYYVDYIYENTGVNPQHIEDIARYPELWGKDIDEPFVAIKSLKVTKDMITLMSPDKSPTIKIALPNGVSLIKFGSSEEEFETLYSETGYVEIDVVGKCGMNERGYKPTPQIYIEDYEIIGRMKYVF